MALILWMTMGVSFLELGNNAGSFFIREKNRLFYREEIECLLFCGHSLYFLKKGDLKR